VLEIDAPITENANGGGDFSIDKTMTVDGAAADAKAVGDLFAEQQKQIDRKQPVGDYALKNEIPVQSVNGKTGAVQLTAADVGAASRETVAKLTETVNTKIGASELTTAVEIALAEAKASGEFDGEDGKTPVKGTDYFTADDKTEMVNLVLAALTTWNGGSY
jgi:hypothetical protein